MSSIVHTRLFAFLSTLIIVPLVTFAVILFARGYRPDPDTKKLEPTGILAATSLPDGAQIIINNEVKSATDNSLNLPPGVYSIQIKKDGFHTWNKIMQLDKETVTRASAFLFSNVPTLKAITSSGAYHPLLSPDGSKIVYAAGNNLYSLDLSDSPLSLISHEPQKLITINSKLWDITFSPDSRQILYQSSASARLIEVNSGNIVEASIGLPQLLNDWKAKKTDQYKRQFASLPLNLSSFLATTSAQLTWNGSDKKILYIATASATMPSQFHDPLPGSNTQPQSRSIKPHHIYVYDMEEDRNFEIGLDSDHWSWYPTGNHIFRLDKSAFIVKEYDNTNETIVFAGPLFENFAVPYPSGKQLLVLTSPNSSATSSGNLYSVNLK